MTGTELPRPFDRRAFVGVMAALTGISLPISGLFNHVHQFEPLTTARHAWMAAHNVMAVLFLAFAGWHVVLNRRAMWKHLQDKVKGTPRREAVAAGAIVGIVLVAAIAHAFVGNSPD